MSWAKAKSDKHYHGDCHLLGPGGYYLWYMCEIGPTVMQHLPDLSL